MSDSQFRPTRSAVDDSAMGAIDYKDLGSTPRVVKTATDMLVNNAVHLARLLEQHPYPGYLSP